MIHYYIFIMSTLEQSIHLICWYSMTLIHLVVLYITQLAMFSRSIAFNKDISDWDTSNATDFVSQWHFPLLDFYHGRIEAIDTFDLLLFHDTHLSILLFYTLHREQCFIVQRPLMETSVVGILLVQPHL
jgi:surface protein